MDSIVSNLLVNTLDTTLIFYYFAKILDQTWKDTKKWAGVLIAVILINIFINKMFELTNLLRYILIFIGGAIIYYNSLGGKFNKVLIYSLVGIILIFSSEVIVMSLTTMVCPNNPPIISQWNICKVVALMASKMFFWVMIRLLTKKRGEAINAQIYNIDELILITFVNIVILFITLNLAKNIEMGSTIGCIQTIIVGTCAIGLNIYIYKVTQDRIYHKQQWNSWQIREKECDKKDFYIKNMNDILHEVKSQKHEFNNCLSVLYGLIYLGKFEESKKYIIDMSGNSYKKIDSIEHIIETNHPVITALISMKKNKALECHIDMEIDIDLPEELPFDFVNLSIIIGNLLDNAIEACEKVPERDERRIELLIYNRLGYLMIEVTNTKLESIKVKNKDILGRFTTKSKDEDHGYGLGNVYHVVKQYNGTLDIEDLGKEFNVNVALCTERNKI